MFRKNNSIYFCHYPVTGQISWMKSSNTRLNYHSNNKKLFWRKSFFSSFHVSKKNNSIYFRHYPVTGQISSIKNSNTRLNYYSNSKKLFWRKCFFSSFHASKKILFIFVIITGKMSRIRKILRRSKITQSHLVLELRCSRHTQSKQNSLLVSVYSITAVY